MKSVTPAATLDEALRRLRDHSGPPEALELAISNSLLDPSGSNMAIITDAALAKDFEPNGFREEESYRVFLYQALD